ncbi:SDR family NAD(P)-dependent oxidoreductase [Sphingomonas oleivorans]|nr:SDR family NAD(P)-dependent oxidoreductase [Sphingomonas oleivorans]
MNEKTVLITGPTDGLGHATALHLARPGVTLLLHGRDRLRGEQILRTVEDAGARAFFYPADFAALDQVESFADRVLGAHPRLDLLINNAGIGFGPPFQRRQESADGHELRLAVNYLAPVLLTERLLPVLIAGAPSRIVNVASAGLHAIDFSDLMLTSDYSGSRAYRQAKLAMIMWTFDLAERLRSHKVTVNALHPATFMNTTMVRQGWGIPMNSVDKGVRALLNLAEGEAHTRTSGAYFNGLDPDRADPQAYDMAARQELRRMTRALLGL